MTVEHPPFRLSPEEDWVFGVKMRGDVLSFGPSGSAVAMALVAAVVMAGMGVLMVLTASATDTINGYEVKNPAAMVTIGIAVAVYALAFLVVTLRAGVRADHHGLTMRRLWRRQQLPWASVAAIRAHETQPQRWWTFVGPNSISWRMNPVPSSSVGVAVLEDGTTVELPGFDAAARSEGLSLGLPTATELKVQALSRYMATVTGRPMPPMEDPPSRLPDTSSTYSWWVLVVYVAVALAIWAIVSWAAGTLVSPLFLVVGLVLALYQTAKHRRAGG